ncbi:hypothetical protein ATCC90586_003254 [Pythium insidiosum]|nr:hypothetical protein ATCC90586_003254 [Pythium insidiosum]
MPRKAREYESSDEEAASDDSSYDDDSSSGGSDDREESSGEEDGGSDDESAEARDQKHKLVENDLIEIRRMIEEMDKMNQSFGLPSSPTNSGVSADASAASAPAKEKTEAQKELEAAKELLFF